jgi:hypothetical protein
MAPSSSAQAPRPVLRSLLLAAAAIGALSAVVAISNASVLELVLPAAPAGAPTSPGPSPRRRSFDAVTVNARCEGCHTEIASEWKTSFHHMAHTDPVYQSQFAKEPFPFCTACHAPEAEATARVPEKLSCLGVGCVTCHVVGEEILAATKTQGTEHDGEHHTLTRTSAFEGPAGCAACHEFAFPEPRRGKDPLLMQSTMKEHAASAHADRSCASCHMPMVAGEKNGPHRSHAFSASRDEAFVRAAIIVDEKPFVNNTLTLNLRPGAVGHAFPTGDMLRRLTLVIDVLDKGGKSIEHEEHFFARHFGFSRETNRPARKVLLKDDRVGASTSPLVFSFAAKNRPEGGHLHYTLRYERVADPTGGVDGRAIVEGSVLLAESTLPFSTSSPGH